MGPVRNVTLNLLEGGWCLEQLVKIPLFSWSCRLPRTRSAVTNGWNMPFCGSKVVFGLLRLSCRRRCELLSIKHERYRVGRNTYIRLVSTGPSRGRIIPWGAAEDLSFLARCCGNRLCRWMSLRRDHNKQLLHLSNALAKDLRPPSLGIGFVRISSLLNDEKYSPCSTRNSCHHLPSWNGRLFFKKKKCKLEKLEFL